MHVTLRTLLVPVVVLMLWSNTLVAAQFDIVILNVKLIDGTGSPYRLADIGVNGDTISAVGDLKKVSAGRTIDGTNLYASPGFIDLHSHADRGLASENVETRKALNLVTQGITTVVVGPDGRNVRWPLTDEIAAFESDEFALNIVPMVGHSTVRGQVMGDDYERVATAAEVSQMETLVREGMQAGAWGLGAGVEYRPGRFSNTEELIALAKVVSEYNGFYISHQRSQSPLPKWQMPSQLDVGWRLTGTDGMLETIRIGRETGIRVVGTHIKAKGTLTWGQSSIDIQLIDSARRDGVQVYLDQYPYETFGGSAVTMLPKWVYMPPGTDFSGGDDDPSLGDASLYKNYKQNIRERLADPASKAVVYSDIQYKLDLQGGASNIIIVECPDDPALIGKNLLEVATQNGRSPIDQLLEFALSSKSNLRSGARFRPFAGSAFDVENYMRQEYTATSTDANIVTETKPGDSPRHFGTYPRKLAYYARDKGVISLAFAVRSSTSLPAQIIGLEDRGLILPGFKADIVLFDLDKLEDQWTVDAPGQYSSGVKVVMSNGVFIVDDYVPSGNRPGKVLLKQVQR